MNDRGFTLIEVLLAAVILSIIGSLTWGAMSATFKTQRTISEITELQEMGTAILAKIREDLSQTFYVETQRPLTSFRGEDNLDHDRILFTALSHYPSKPQAKESDQAEIFYETESNPSNSSFFLLKRKETPYLGDQPSQVDEGVEFTTIASNLLTFNLEYSDGNTFRPTWDIRSPELLNKLPKLVRISFSMKDPVGREQTFETTVDIPMSEGLGITPTLSPGVPNTGQTGPAPNQPQLPGPIPGQPAPLRPFRGEQD